MGRAKTIIGIILIVMVSVAIAVFLKVVIESLPDSRKHGKAIDTINTLSERMKSVIPEGKTLRYTIYTHADTIYRNQLTGQYLDELNSAHYTIDDLNKIRRLRNKEFVYYDDFGKKGYAITRNYIIVKTVKYNRVRLRAYFKKDPTTNDYTNFWYNGEILTSGSTLHTFDAYTGKGISTNMNLTQLMIEEDTRERY